MVKPMVEAASKILEEGIVNKEHLAHYVKCAKSLLDSLLKELNTDKVPTSETSAPIGGHVMYEITADKGRLYRIKDNTGNELEDDKLVKLDGVTMSYAEAKGRPFTKGEVL